MEEYTHIPYGAVDPSVIIALRAQGHTYAEIARKTGYGAMESEIIANAHKRGSKQYERDEDGNTRRAMSSRRLNMRLSQETREQLLWLARDGATISSVIARAVDNLYRDEIS